VAVGTASRRAQAASASGWVQGPAVAVDTACSSALVAIHPHAHCNGRSVTCPWPLGERPPAPRPGYLSHAHRLRPEGQGQYVHSAAAATCAGRLRSWCEAPGDAIRDVDRFGGLRAARSTRTAHSGGWLDGAHALRSNGLSRRAEAGRRLSVDVDTWRPTATDITGVR